MPQTRDVVVTPENLDRAKSQFPGFAPLLNVLFGGASSGAAQEGSTKSARIARTFKYGDKLKTTKQMESADGSIVIPAGTPAVFLGINPDKERGTHVDVAWMSQDVDDNGKRWIAKHFTKA